MESTTKENKYDSNVIAIYCFMALLIVGFWTGLYYLGDWIIGLF